VNVPRVYTFQEAGVLLGTSPDTVRRLVRSGRLRAVNVAHGKTRARFRVREDDLAKFIDDNTHQMPTGT